MHELFRSVVCESRVQDFNEKTNTAFRKRGIREKVRCSRFFVVVKINGQQAIFVMMQSYQKNNFHESACKNNQYLMKTEGSLNDVACRGDDAHQ